MSNSSDRLPQNPKRDPKLGSQENLNSHVEAVSPTSYKEGYIHGRASERSVETERQEIREENTAARGLLLGIALTSLIGLTAGTLFFLNQNQQPEPSTPIVVPQRNAPPTPAKETTIIERTTEIQQPSPVQQDTQTIQPNIQITVPTSEQQPTSTQPKTKPSTLPEQSQNQNIPTNSGATQQKQNTAPQSTQIPAPTKPSNTTNPTSSGQPENQSSTDTTTTTQPDTTNQAAPTQTKNQNQSSNSGQ